MDMPIADRLQPASKIVGRATFLGNCLEVEQKAGGLIVAGRVAAFDLALHLTPDAFAAPRERIEPNTAGARLFRRLPFSFSLSLLLLRALAGLTDRLGTGSQFDGRARSDGGSSRRGLQRLAILNERPQLACYMRIALHGPMILIAFSASAFAFIWTASLRGSI
ncbi:hypothetical protein [Mesorhizobium sp. M0185]|uniref:hypothetical protein n=1 Tax=unclassified Mesorhizobium TaxID=325217 RepID=UPI003336FE60